ncbi:MAG: Succinyl-diaminopimelate desuccinylase [Actinobacteria bacterium ADurb.Bin444]|nr:MAG: Succinyl-diaminopimelate desuccinylase [Actinobacteria bacterium ADurb.Bin444]
MVSTDLSERLRWRIEGYRNAMVDFQRDLTAVNAVGPTNGGDGEWQRAGFVREALNAMGMGRVRELHAVDSRAYAGQRPNLMLIHEGLRNAPVVWVMAHLDTVPPGDESLWETPPFEAVERDGRLYGRGVEDNQQGLTSMIFALRAVLEEGLVPTSDVGLMFVSDEETGNAYGLIHVLQVAHDLFEPGDLVVVPDFGSPEGDQLEVAEKSVLQVELTVRGRQAHASMPDAGVNTHRVAGHLVVRLDQLLHEKFGLSDPMFDPPASTFEPTRHDANVSNVNTIPGIDRLWFDCRVLPSVDLDEVKAAIDSVARAVAGDFGATIDVNYTNENPAAPPTAADAPVVLAVAEAVRQVRGVEPKIVGIGGGTVAAEFRRRGIPAVAWSTCDAVAHQPNEYSVIDNMVSDALVLAHLFVRDQ